MKKIIELTDQNFEKEVLQSKNFVLVDFWAEWCNPCKILAPILEEVAQEYFHKIKFGKLNIEKNGYADEKWFEEIDAKIKSIVDESVKFAEESPWPEASELYTDVYVQKDYPYIKH